MAHFAKLGINGKVLSVEVVADADTQGADGTELESVGIDFLNKVHGWPLWAKTSYNTRGNKYYNADGSEGDASKAYRGNYAGIGFTYDTDNDVFYGPQPHSSWTLSSDWVWEAPIAYPDDGNAYIWNENAYQGDNTQGWELVNE